MFALSVLWKKMVLSAGVPVVAARVCVVQASRTPATAAARLSREQISCVANGVALQHSYAFTGQLASQL